MLAKATVSSEGSLGKDPPHSSLTVIGRIQSLEGCWTEDLSPLLKVGLRPSLIPCHVALSHVTAHNVATCFIKVSCQEGKSMCAGGEGTSLLNKSLE